MIILTELGVDFVELMPVNAFNGTHGYDGVAWYAVHEPYAAAPAAYQQFVDACHSRGLAVIQDVVYNHHQDRVAACAQYGPYLTENAANTWGAAINLDGEHSDEVRHYILDNAAMWLGLSRRRAAAGRVPPCTTRVQCTYSRIWPSRPVG